MKPLILNAVEKIKAWHQRWPNAVVLWSGGKDSTALLHLIRFQAKIDLPVVQFREPKFRERYEYSDAIIKAWNLEMHEYPAGRFALADGPDVETGVMRFDLLKFQQWGPGTSIVLSLGTERPKPGEKYLCGVDFLQRPTASFVWPWAAAFIGTKESDTDPIKGHVPLAVDVRHVKDSPVSLYPLREWSDEDVYSYLEFVGVDPDPNRYMKAPDGWMHNPDKSMNADYIPTCLNCIDRHADRYVHCPKLKATVLNMSELAPYEDMVFPDLGFRPVWKEKDQPKMDREEVSQKDES